VCGVLFRLDRAVQQSLNHQVPLPDADIHPALTIIKPVFGADAYSAENFRSWANQDYPGPLELIYSFQTSDDPSLSIARQITGPPPIG
jgi:ceramide glucosyltransferase